MAKKKAMVVKAKKMKTASAVAPVKLKFGSPEWRAKYFKKKA